MMMLAAAVLMAGSGVAHAVTDSLTGGGVLQQGFDALQQELTRRDDPTSLLKLKVVDESTTPVVGFTPRFAGVPIDLAEGVSVDRGSVLKSRFSAPAGDQQSRALQFRQTHDLGLVKVDLSAIAGFADQGTQELGQSSTFGFGGGLMFDRLGGLRFDASYSRLDESLGLALDSISAGVGYDFGPLDTRLSVSNVSQYDANGISTEEQQIWALGGEMALSSHFVVGGDLAYSTKLDGTADTSGVVNFRFNF